MANYGSSYSFFIYYYLICFSYNKLGLGEVNSRWLTFLILIQIRFIGVFLGNFIISNSFNDYLLTLTLLFDCRMICFDVPSQEHKKMAFEDRYEALVTNISKTDPFNVSSIFYFFILYLFLLWMNEGNSTSSSIGE